MRDRVPDHTVADDASGLLLPRRARRHAAFSATHDVGALLIVVVTEVVSLGLIEARFRRELPDVRAPRCAS